MAAPFIPHLLAASGAESLIFAFEQSTLPGRLVLLSLFIASIFSWTVMITKFRIIRRAQARRDQFLSLFRTARQPLRIYTDQIRFDGAPLFAVYKAGCQELTFQLLGSAEVDETFRDRLDSAPRISPAQMRAVTPGDLHRIHTAPRRRPGLEIETGQLRAVGQLSLRVDPSALRGRLQPLQLVTKGSGFGDRLVYRADEPHG